MPTITSLPPRIGFVSALQGTEWGGSEELWSRTAASLAQSGVTVGVNAVRWPRPVPQIEELERRGCSVTLRSVYTDGPLHRRAVRRLRQVFTGPPTRWLERFRPDLVLISMDSQISGLTWMQACGRLGIPYVLLVQSAIPAIWPDDAAAAPLAAGYEGAAACLFVSQNNIEFVRWQLAIALADARVVRNTFNVAYDAAPPWPAVDGTFRLANVARLDMGAKGQDVLFQVLSQEKWRQRPLEVSLFGSGPNAAVIARLLDLYALKRVSLRGFTPDVEAIWAGHHALVLPSRFEGLPLALVEAMLCGRPAIVTDVAGNAEVVEDNETGFVAAAPTAVLLDEALERAWARRSEWQAMGRLAGRRVRSLVPADPAEVFAGDLLRLAAEQTRPAPARRG